MLDRKNFAHIRRMFVGVLATGATTLSVGLTTVAPASATPNVDQTAITAASAAVFRYAAAVPPPPVVRKYPNTASKSGWVQPLDPSVAKITDVYGSRGHNHFGADYAARPNTKAAVRAAHDGTVKRTAGTARSGGYGNMIDVYHKGIGTRYAHLSKMIVKAGQKVKAGQIIGYQGSTGQSTGPHLHFEVHKVSWSSGWWGHGTTVNPQTFMKKQGAPLI